MPLCSIADFVVDFANQHDYLEKQCVEYRHKGNAPAEFTIRVTDDDLRQERFLSDRHYSDGYLESICAYRKLCLALPLRDALLLHGSVIACEGRGIAFLAHSGVGKTTHTMLWKRVYPEEVSVINGDKPIVRFWDGVPYAYGTPWAGKEGIQTNTRVRLTDLCFIERSESCSVEKADKGAYVNALMMQMLHPSDPEAAIKTLELSDRLLSSCNMWVIKCNISEDAARIAHDTIIGDM